MAVLYFPSNADRILSQGRPFIEALLRYRGASAFRKAPYHELPAGLRNNLSPLVVTMVEGSLPGWVTSLAEEQPLIVASQSESTLQEAQKTGHVFPVLLRGLDDMRGFYAALRGLCAERSRDDRLDNNTRSRLEKLGGVDLLAKRSLLDFIPAFPLPQPDRGRPAAYLLNRLSNVVEEPTLQSDDEADDQWQLPQLLKWSVRGCAALALVEAGDTVPAKLRVGRDELEGIRFALLANTDRSKRFETLIDLGRRAADENWLSSIFLTVPAARRSFLRGQVPPGVTLERDHRRMARVGLHALSDFVEESENRRPKDPPESDAYNRARETLLLEQRVLACETAVLTSRAASIPTQIRVRDSHVYNVVRNLNQAIDTKSRKVPDLFREVERSLAALLPARLLADLEQGNSTVQILSDLPFEWTLVDGWPLCLTRPVSRIPIGVTEWDVLSAALERSVTLNSKTPDRVLVLDLIPAHDPIREESDSFARVSNSLSQNYVYASPPTPDEFRNLIAQSSAEIVVLDTHGRYDDSKDEVFLDLPGGTANINELLPSTRVPPLWILSACDTSVTGAMRGCVVRRLLERGAVCVIATLALVDAFTASTFVGRLLTDLYNPIKPGAYTTFDRIFFVTQFTTALLYDPLLPLLRKARHDRDMMKSLGGVLGSYYAWAGNRPIEDVRRFRYEAAEVLDEAIKRNGLTSAYADAVKAGNVRPETLLFSAFGVPQHLDIVSS
jgi:hypothetical protein